MPSLHDTRGSVRKDSSDADGPIHLALTGHRDAVAEAHLDGFRMGRQEGLPLGIEEGRAQVADATRSSLDALNRATETYRDQRAFAVSEIEQLAVELALELTEVLLGRQLEAMEPGADVIARALELRRGADQVRIRMHPDDAALLDEHPHPDIQIVGDPTLSPGEAIAESAGGLSDISIDAAVARVREALS